jgi:hypothetical protein
MQNLEHLLSSFGFIVQNAHISEAGHQKNFFVEVKPPQQAPGCILELKGWANKLLQQHGWDGVDALQSKIFTDVLALHLKANKKAD